MHRVFVSMGSNIDSERNMRAAARRLATRCRVLAASRVYRTPPVGTADQPDYLNAALLVETGFSAAELKQNVLGPIEHQLGRVRTRDRYGPRTIDLDIALFDDAVIELDGRRIPDPDVERYAHVAVPLAEIAPEYRHPLSGRTLREIADSLPGAPALRATSIELLAR